MNGRRRIPVACAFVVALVIGALPAAAQDRLFLDGSELGALGRFGESIGLARGLDGLLAGGGRFLVPEPFTGERDVVDLHTGARRALPPSAEIAALDPARPRLILWLPGTAVAGTFDLAVYDVVSGTAETVLTQVCALSVFGGPAAAAYAYDAERLVSLRCSAPGVVDALASLDLAESPRRVRLLPVPRGTAGLLDYSALTVSSDGRRLFVRINTGFLTAVVDAYDLESGGLVGSAAANGRMQWDDGLDALLVISGGGFADSEVTLFGRAMERLGSAVLATVICPARIEVSPHTGRIYVTTNGANNTGALPTVLEVFAGVPLRSAGRVTVSPLGQTSCRGARLRTAPGPPRGLHATVNGRDVALDWTNVGGASAFVLDVGLAAGRTDLSLFLGPDSAAAFRQVPSGSYYLRVRGGNAFGGGRASEEVRVVVP
jgi:hypothetical protein